MDTILTAIGSPLIVTVLVVLIYWITDWIRRVLKDKLASVWIQPIALLIGTILAAFVLYTYDYRPVDIGEAKYIVVDFILQGAILAALAGVLYDKIGIPRSSGPIKIP